MFLKGDEEADVDGIEFLLELRSPLGLFVTSGVFFLFFLEGNEEADADGIEFLLELRSPLGSRVCLGICDEEDSLLLDFDKEVFSC